MSWSLKAQIYFSQLQLEPEPLSWAHPQTPLQRLPPQSAHLPINMEAISTKPRSKGNSWSHIHLHNVEENPPGGLSHCCGRHTVSVLMTSGSVKDTQPSLQQPSSQLTSLQASHHVGPPGCHLYDWVLSCHSMNRLQTSPRSMLLLNSKIKYLLLQGSMGKVKKIHLSLCSCES